MDWTELSVATNPFGADLVSEALMAAGAQGAQIIDRTDLPVPGEPSRYWELADPSLGQDYPEGVMVKAWFAEPAALEAAHRVLGQLRERLRGRAGSLNLSAAPVREEDWAESWKRYYKPQRFGRRLVVRPSWEPFEPRPGDLVIDLDPGMAFGTGTHETTALCLELLEARWQPGPMADIGTGSGILAIAAARLGSAPVTAVDLDPVAVRVARENIGRNGLEGTVEARQGNLCDALMGLQSLVCANILADAILILIPQLRSRLKPGGLFISSGILLEREAEVAAALQAAGYRLEEARRQGSWSALAARWGGAG